jgi:hypothetical protein
MRTSHPPGRCAGRLHSPARSLWALAHTVSRHGAHIERAVVLQVDVPRSWLRRSKTGLWYSVRDVPADRIGGVVTFGALARSPVGETAA